MVESAVEALLKEEKRPEVIPAAITSLFLCF
jgi:hypothetical protein